MIMSVMIIRKSFKRLEKKSGKKGNLATYRSWYLNYFTFHESVRVDLNLLNPDAFHSAQITNDTSNHGA